jgi:hypothetical protein
MDATLMLYGLGAAVSALSLQRLKARLDLSRAKHPSLRGHARLASRLAKVVPFYDRSDLVALARKKRVPLLEDVGSGALVDLRPFGLPEEPLLKDALRDGVPLACASGDKLLGGPQAGILAGTRKLVDACRTNPMARALRLDKLTIAALEATLRLYRDPEAIGSAIPTLRMLAEPASAVRARARRLIAALGANHAFVDPDLCAPYEVDPTRRWHGRARIVARPDAGWRDALDGLPGNPPDAIASCRDKARTRSALSSAGLPQPRWIAVTDPDAAADAVARVGLPCVVKPHRRTR